MLLMRHMIRRTPDSLRDASFRLMSATMSQPSSSQSSHKGGHGSVVFTFLKENQQPMQIVIHEIYSPEYALFTWPAAPVMAQYVWFNDHLFKGETVLEIGCGTSLPGIVAAKRGSRVILSDKFTPQSRELLVKNVTDNECRIRDFWSPDALDDPKPIVRLTSLTWGDISADISSLPLLDFILASDCFYDESDFEDIVVTIAYLLKEKGHEKSCCLTSYQVRNSEWNIACLMHRYGLEGHEVPLQQFEAASHQLLGSKLPGFHTISLFLLKLKKNNVEPDGK